MGKKKKYRGHYCWCCGRVRPNEKFSNKGRRRHVCKECQKLGKEELDYRQHQRDIDRLLNWDGLIRRKSVAVFQRYLTHNNMRVRAYAKEIFELSERRREELREMYRAEQEEEERMLTDWESLEDDEDRRLEKEEEDIEDLEEIPF